MATLAGCSDRNAASEQNFTRALEPLVADRFCKIIEGELMTTSAQDGDGATLLPLVLRAEPLANSAFREEGARTRAMLESAAREGLLTRTMTTAPARRRRYQEVLVPTAMVVFAPTETGKAVFRTVERESTSNGLQPYPAVCMGRGRVDQVVRWTEPAELFGRTVTRVTYKFSATEIPAMAPADLRGQLAEPKEATATLMKTSDGWQPAR